MPSPLPLSPPSKRRPISRLRTLFLTGLVIIAPVLVTAWIIIATIEFIDNRVLPLIPRRLLPEFLTGLTFPGMGVLIFLILTTAVGWLARGYIGRSLIAWGERIIYQMPVVRSVYQGIKQIAETLLTQRNTSFSRACLVQYPRHGIWAVAFISAPVRGELAGRIAGQAPHLAVFLPTTPNPTSGFLLFVPEADVIPLDMSVEDAAKLVISAGLVAPGREMGATLPNPLG